MPTQKYLTKDGELVPGVTTIINRFKQSGALIHWAWKLGRDGKDYKEVMRSAADSGTLAHDAIECWIRKKPFVWPVGEAEMVARARRSFDAFLKWADSTKLVPDRTELPLVSDKHRFGGCFDAVLIGSSRVMADWKTSKAVYPDHRYQLAAYAILWEEHFPDQPLDGGFLLVRFDKETAEFEERRWPDLSDEKRAFLKMRELYEITKKVEAAHDAAA